MKKLFLSIAFLLISSFAFTATLQEYNNWILSFWNKGNCLIIKSERYDSVKYINKNVIKSIWVHDSRINVVINDGKTEDEYSYEKYTVELDSNNNLVITRQ